MAELDGRYPAWAGAGALALSALIGLAAGVQIGVLLIRAIAFAALFAAAAVGAWYLSRRYLAELVPSDDAGLPAHDSSRMGPRVDIVVDGDADERLYSGAGGELHGELGALTDSPEYLSDYRSEDPGELEREAEELRGETLLPAEAVEDVAPIRAARPSTSFEDLDVLPDLDGFTDSFAPSVRDAEAEARGEPASVYSGAAHSGSGASRDGMDPATIAKAVQTLLKKDQKG